MIHWNDDQEVLMHIEDDLRTGAFEMTHVNNWRKAQTIESFSEREEKRKGLLSSWFDFRWQTTFCGHKIVGDLKTVSEYGSMDEPTFTIEFADPDYPSGDMLTLTGHFSRFERK